MECILHDAATKTTWPKIIRQSIASLIGPSQIVLYLAAAYRIGSGCWRLEITFAIVAIATIIFLEVLARDARKAKHPPVATEAAHAKNFRVLRLYHCHITGVTIVDRSKPAANWSPLAVTARAVAAKRLKAGTRKMANQQIVGISQYFCLTRRIDQCIAAHGFLPAKATVGIWRTNSDG